MTGASRAFRNSISKVCSYFSLCLIMYDIYMSSYMMMPPPTLAKLYALSLSMYSSRPGLSR